MDATAPPACWLRLVGDESKPFNDRLDAALAEFRRDFDELKRRDATRAAAFSFAVLPMMLKIPHLRRAEHKERIALIAELCTDFAALHVSLLEALEHTRPESRN